MVGNRCVPSYTGGGGGGSLGPTAAAGWAAVPSYRHWLNWMAATTNKAPDPEDDSGGGCGGD